VPRINIAYVVGVTERTLDSGGKQVIFNASSLEQL
jgi:hypothetical protein